MKNLLIMMTIAVFFTNSISIMATDEKSKVTNEKSSEEEIIEIGKDYANMNQASVYSGENWKLQSKELLYSQGPVKGDFIIGVEKAMEKSQEITVTLPASFTFKISASFSVTVQQSSFSSTYSRKFKGPEKDDILPNGKIADKRYFVNITYGTVYKYNYKVYDNYSGRYLRDVSVTVVEGAIGHILSQLAYVNSDGSITVANKDNTKVKKYANESSYKSILNKYSYNCDSVIEF